MDSDRDLRSAYPDLLTGADDEERIHVLRLLDTGYRAVYHGLVPPPPALARPPDESRAARAKRSRSPHRRAGSMQTARHALPRRPGWRMSAPVLAVLTLAVCVTLAVAATSIINLGKPTNTQSTNAYFPLGGFRHGAPVLQAAGKPELLWTGTAWPGDPASSAERWPLVKALAQFGSFDTMNVAKQVCISSTYNLGGQITVHPCTIPTFDWSRATYRSPYLSFVHKDLIDARGHLFQRLSGDETGLFDRYVRRKTGNQVKQIAASIYDPDAAPSDVSRSFPLLLIGGYRQTLTGEPSIGGFGSQRWPDTDPKVTHGLPYIMYEQTLSFQQARAALATGRTPHLAAITGQPPPDFSSLIPDVNAEANIITALICHADGKRPARICGRSVVRQILKHVK